MKHLYLALSLGILTTLFVIPYPVYADGTGLTVSPAILELHGTPPADIISPITLENQADASLQLQILLKPFKQAPSEDGKIEYLTSQSSEMSFLPNVSIVDHDTAISALTLGPKQKKTVTLKIALPNTTALTDHYFSVVFLSIPQNPTTTNLQDKNTISLIQSGIGIPILLSVASDNHVSGFLEGFSAPVFQQTGPVDFRLRIKNSGEHFITPRGTIMITNMFGQTVGRVDLPEANILAHTTRSIQKSWPEKFLLGFYTATLSLALSDQGPVYTREVSFASFPFQAFFVLVLISSISFVLVRRVRKKLAEE